MWNRELDEVEKITLFKLKEKGYRAVDKKHIIHFREIYDFICRFADSEYSGGDIRLRMSNGDVPKGTSKIIHTIGIDKLYLYFSPMAYKKYFLQFCEKLIRTKKISSSDYLSDGLIIADKLNVETHTYKGN